jgi:dihydroorotate dehydrogenase electron transfer subunit
MPKRIEDFIIRRNRKLNDYFFVLELDGMRSLPEIKPGQFVQVKVEGSPETFLRRPVSVHDVDYQRNILKLLIQLLEKALKLFPE